jgi:antirestriction protein ArdC
MKAKFDIATVVTQRILHSIETGEFSKFIQSWSSRQASHPINFATKKPYSGVNVWLLGMTEFSRPEWLTYKQAAELGGQVRKGEESTMACFYSPVASSKKDTDGKSSTYSLLRHFSLFNVEQIDGLELPELPALPKPSGSEMSLFLQDRAASLGVGLRHLGDSAYYERLADRVTMPSTAFISDAAYSAVLAHELIHATGAPSRLNRKKGEKFGDSDYAKEELVAELGSAFMCAQFGISNTYGLQHESYLASWLKVLGNDNKAFFKASSMADKAFKLICPVSAEDFPPAPETDCVVL